MTKKKRKKLYRLIEKWTRSEVMARMVPTMQWPEWGDYFHESQRYENKIRELMFGTSDLTELGHHFGLPIDPPRRKKKRK